MRNWGIKWNVYFTIIKWSNQACSFAETKFCIRYTLVYYNDSYQTCCSFWQRMYSQLGHRWYETSCLFVCNSHLRPDMLEKRAVYSMSADNIVIYFLMRSWLQGRSLFHDRCLSIIWLTKSYKPYLPFLRTHKKFRKCLVRRCTPLSSLIQMYNCNRICLISLPRYNLSYELHSQMKWLVNAVNCIQTWNEGITCLE